MVEENKTNETNTEPTKNETNNSSEEINILEKIEEIKNNYEQQLKKKDNEIAELQKNLKQKEGEVGDTINHLNDEVKEKLAQAEELNQLRESVQELMQDKAEALVDKYIHQGKLVPAQRPQALDLCLKDQDMFINLYENSPQIVDTTNEPRTKKIPGDVDKIANYFKN